MHGRSASGSVQALSTSSLTAASELSIWLSSVACKRTDASTSHSPLIRARCPFLNEDPLPQCLSRISNLMW